MFRPACDGAHDRRRTAVRSVEGRGLGEPALPPATTLIALGRPAAAGGEDLQDAVLQAGLNAVGVDLRGELEESGHRPRSVLLMDVLPASVLLPRLGPGDDGDGCRWWPRRRCLPAPGRGPGSRSRTHRRRGSRTCRRSAGEGAGRATGESRSADSIGAPYDTSLSQAARWARRVPLPFEEGLPPRRHVHSAFSEYRAAEVSGGPEVVPACPDRRGGDSKPRVSRRSQII